MLTIRVLLLLLTVYCYNAFGVKDPVKFLRYGFPKHQPLDKIGNGRELKIICHGLNASSDTFWYQPMIKGFRKKKFAIIAIDWKDLADDGYIDAVLAATNVSGELVNELLKVKEKYNIDLSAMHIIGHSLGAHIAGYTGKMIANLTGEKIGRITGLDPAGPGFQTLLSNSRLSKEDARFVDVIHTDTDLLGINLSIGHADFFPNGGALQNSCDIVDVGCSHIMATKYFIESISADNFIAKKCDSYLWYVWGFCSNNEKAIMGYGCDLKANGDYFLSTNSKSPYGKGL